MGLIAGLAIILGIICFLIVEHALLFWLAFVPLVIILVLSLIKWVTHRRLGLSYAITALTSLGMMLVVVIIAAIPEKCEHEEMVTRYVFTTEDSTAYSSVIPYCRNCEKQFQSTNFNGTPVDQSYLEAIKEHSDGTEIVPGEYYTVTVTAPLGFYGYNSKYLRLSCEAENEEYIVRFSAEFREEFRKLVESIEDGDEITFRGRFYEEGCEFTDCELLSN